MKNNEELGDNKMNDIKLIKPTMKYADGIMSFRHEVLDANDTFAGCGSLRKYCVHYYIYGLMK